MRKERETPAGPIRVLIVEDSRVVRGLLEHIVGADPRLTVVASVGSGEEALRVLPTAAPDVISLDMRLPGIDGFETTRRIMAERPTPIVVVSASVEDQELAISMNALRAGALAVVEKPVGVTAEPYRALAERICTQLVIMSQVAVVRQRRAPAAPPRAAPPPLGGDRSGAFALLAVVTSTGGPAALAILLEGLGPRFPLPVVVLQHMAPAFHGGFLAWLGGLSPLAVEGAKQGRRPRPGTVHLAPADAHLRLRGGCFEVSDGAPVDHQRPSGDLLLTSLANELGPRALALVLTGMGEDGARGLLAVRRAGGYTLVEDASTAVVYGMPAAAVTLGAACESLPLPALAPRILELARSGA